MSFSPRFSTSARFTRAGFNVPAPPPPRGLYAITPDEADTQRLQARVAAVLPFAALVQYRNKAADAALRRAQVQALLPLCRAAGVPLIVNDDLALAAALGLGVHLGEDDGDIAQARAQLGPWALIGASCYDDPARAASAAAAGASYVAYGAFFPSPTKPAARRASTALLEAGAGLGVWQVAIGGITADNAAPLVAAGADLIAVVSGVFDAPDPAAAARACQALYGIPAPAQGYRMLSELPPDPGLRAL